MRLQIKSKHRISFLVLGISSILIQIGLLRESLALLHGNELIMGLFLSVWMLETALGAWLGRWMKTGTWIVILHILIPFLSFLSFAMLPAIISVSSPPGSTAEIVHILLAIAGHLATVCIPLGMLFPIITSFSKQEDIKIVSNGYAVEGLGSIIGGIIFYVGLVMFLDISHVWIFLIVCNFLAALLLIKRTRIFKYILGISLGMVGLVMVYVILFVNLPYRHRTFDNEEVIKVLDSPYGRLKAALMHGQVNIYQDNLPLLSAQQKKGPEEDIHFGMAHHPSPKNVLIISGGDPAVISEVLKYNVGQITYMEMDPWLFDFSTEFLGFEIPANTEIVKRDPIRTLSDSKDLYDIIFILLPAPSNTLINRYYSREFFSLAKQHLRKDGLFVTSLGTSGNYLNDESIIAHSVLYNTLGSCFNHVLITPAGRNYFIASEYVLDHRAIHNIETKGIPTAYVNSDYFDDDLIRMRSERLLADFNPEAPLNTNFKPLNYRYQLLHQLNLYAFDPNILLMILIVVILLGLVFLSPAQTGIFSGSFTLASMQILIMIAFQVFFGMLFFAAGIFITLFMTGLFAGTIISGRSVIISKFKSLIINQLIIGATVLIFCLLIWIYSLSSVNGILIHTTLYLLTLFCGFLMGIHFSIGSMMTKGSIGKIASGSYGVDLAGASIGTLLVSFYIFPVFGLYITCLMLAGLNILAVIINAIKMKNRLYL